MDYLVHLVPGEPYVKGPIAAHHHKVPCPACLRPMILTDAKLVEIYTHMLIDNGGRDLEVMCYDCADDETFHDEPKKVKRIRNLELYD